MYPKWVRLKKYCELTKEPESSFRKLRSNSLIVDGIHSKIAADGCLWVNIEAMDKWISESVYRKML